MTITLQPDQERAIQDAIRAGVFRSVEEFIDAAITHMPEIVQPAQSRPMETVLTVAESRRLEGRKSLVELFAESPFKGLNIEFDESESEKDLGRNVEL